MIFVTVGSTVKDFSRLLQWVDYLLEEDLLHDVVAQVGSSAYQPTNYAAYRFLPRSRMSELIEAAEFVVSHGGAATLDECLGLRRKVIVVPRRAEFGESPDNHQFEIAEHLADLNRVLLARDLNELRCRVTEVADWQPVFSSKGSTRMGIVAAIHEFMERTIHEKRLS